jgi:hypothetical protein
MLHNDLPVVARVPYQADLVIGSVTRPPFVANHSAGKFSAEDYYQQMIMSQMERQEIEEQEQEHHQAEREECLAELEIQRQEGEQKLEGEMAKRA